MLAARAARSGFYILTQWCRFLAFLGSVRNHGNANATNLTNDLIG